MQLPLAPTQKLVLLSLAFHADQKDGKCYPSVAAMAEETGLSRRAVQMNLRTLEADGVISTEGLSGGRKRRTTFALCLSLTAQDVRPSENRKGASDADKGRTSFAERAHHVRPSENRKGASDADKGRTSFAERAHHVRDLKGINHQGTTNEPPEKSEYEKAFAVLREIRQWPSSREPAGITWLTRDGISEDDAYQAAIALKGRYDPKKHIDLVATLVKWAHNQGTYRQQRSNGSGPRSTRHEPTTDPEALARSYGQ